ERPAWLSAYRSAVYVSLYVVGPLLGMVLYDANSRPKIVSCYQFAMHRGAYLKRHMGTVEQSHTLDEWRNQVRFGNRLVAISQRFKIEGDIIDQSVRY